LLFVDDDEAFLRTVQLAVGSKFEIGTATTLASALAVTARPDVGFIDLGLPDGDGVDLIAQLGHRWADTPLVALTVARADARVMAAFRAGARGYLLKEDVGDRLSRAVEEALEGGAPMSAAVARKVLRMVAQLPDARPVADCGEPLTEREIRVVQELSSGCSYAQAAASLYISVNTLRTHVRSVYRKLSVGSKTEAVMAALQLGLLDPPS
jgi:DNA-binding NarL/FixJ family response regulator